MATVFSHFKGYGIDSVLQFNVQTWLYLFSWGVDFFKHISATKFTSRGVWLLTECDAITQANLFYGRIPMTAHIGQLQEVFENVLKISTKITITIHFCNKGKRKCMKKN